MASRNFNRKQCLEKEIKDLYLEANYKALIQASASLATTSAIALTKAAGGAADNGYTFKTVVNAAAANPTNTVLVAFTGTAAAIVCTITPNDGTHNSATPVNLTTAQLVTLINNGSVATVTLTDSGSLRPLQTATGGNTTVLAHAGNGDNVTATFSGGQNEAIKIVSKWGISSLVENSGYYRLSLEDEYAALKFFDLAVENTVAADQVFQIKAVRIVGTKTPYIDFIVIKSGSAAIFQNNDNIKILVEVKNTSVV